MKNAGRWICQLVVVVTMMVMTRGNHVAANIVFMEDAEPKRFLEKPPELRYKAPPAIPGYSIGAGVVAVTLTFSWVALRVIRKRQKKTDDSQGSN